LDIGLEAADACKDPGGRTALVESNAELLNVARKLIVEPTIMADAPSVVFGVLSLASSLMTGAREMYYLLEWPLGFTHVPLTIHDFLELAASQSIVEAGGGLVDILGESLQELSSMTERALKDKTLRGMRAEMRAVANTVEEMRLQLCEYEAKKQWLENSKVTLIPSYTLTLSTDVIFLDVCRH
jgi:hypothetical protein